MAREELIPVTISFGDAAQVFNIGPASVGTYGVPAGIAYAGARYGSLPLAELVAPAVTTLARALRSTPSRRTSSRSSQGSSPRHRSPPRCSRPKGACSEPAR